MALPYPDFHLLLSLSIHGLLHLEELGLGALQLIETAQTLLLVVTMLE